MTPESATKEQYADAEDALELAHLATVLEQNPDAPAEARRFGPLLAKTLSRENGRDQTILRAAVTVLRTHDSDAAADWLVNELEIESSLQYGSVNASDRPKACLLFAIPVVFASLQPPGASLIVNRNFEALHGILTDAQVVSATHGFRLLPQLFTYETLSSLTHHEVLKATLSLGRQVLDAPVETPALEPLAELRRRPAGSVRVDDYPHVQLRYLVGMGATDRAALDELFPTLESDVTDTPAERAMQGLPATAAGRMAGGAWWTVPFAQVIEICSQSVTPVLEVASPDGFHDALRLGTERMRMHDARLRIEYGAGALGLDTSAVHAEVLPLSDGFGNLTGLSLELFAPGESEPFDSLLWERLPHENLTELREELEMLTELLGLKGAGNQLLNNVGLHLH